MEKLVKRMIAEINDVIAAWEQDVEGPGIDPASTTPRAFIYDIMLAMAFTENQDEELAALLDKFSGNIKEHC